ncbi:Cyclopropane-fatty-acyl-phospholipid synthase [Polystyrenella longa]|uniref:Cyclopropane-fatty-acyl-phospholipid synthase n=1 Tax=Polystyrenella longa TaxID=2528007 RepID=A0A518CK70_9PLAN|nr:cyclopropane-fatty-acyl-phospholipid synthase family protein [Polystyrenella longa]QDU79621.1 Cyclopropane-fatty-acyl-phospholipid synthase [Polystyrenella longa]
MSQMVSNSQWGNEESLAIPQCNSGQFISTDTNSQSEAALATLPRLYRQVLFRIFKKLHTGHLTIVEPSGTTQFGKIGSGLEATIHIQHPSFYGRVIREGGLGAAESYLQGEWTTNDLTSLLRLMVQNQTTLKGISRGRSWVARGIARLGHLLRDNSQAGSKRNIHEHYDLGNDFFKLFLDETMMYSSAYFENENTPLREASEAKLEMICRKLQLSPADHVLEIGTGWGGFAEYAARKCGCRITTTTISQEQYQFAKERIERAGMSEQVELLLEDYRDLQGTYDKLVSIEMIEAVGHRHLDGYFKACSQLLKADGTMLIQAITIPDQRYEQYQHSVDFIQKYIFPGGALPSVEAMLQSTSRTDLRLLDLQDFASHYSQTLRIWRDRFFANTTEIESQGFSERFQRMWEYYFCYCEAAFEERATGVSQLVFAKPEARLEVSGS